MEVVHEPMVLEPRAPLEWQPLVNGMTNVQKLVHLACRKTVDYEAELQQKLFQETRNVYAETMRWEVMSLGCGDPGNVTPTKGPSLKALSDRSKFAAKSITNTFNYDLARAIIAIGKDTPTANRNVYAHRLNAWEQARWIMKQQDIAMAETFTAINQSKADFHRNNPNLGVQGEVAPYDTVCPICAGYVAGNPYRSMEALYRQVILPAHNFCPHFGRAIQTRTITKDECRELWLGD